jgi:hemolysin III
MTATPSPSLREEVANAISHGLGLLLALASLPVLAAAGWLPARPGGVLGTAVFALTMMLVLPGVHRLPRAAAGPRQAWLQLADHAAIFLFIAGSFTPFALRNLDSAQGLAGLCAGVGAGADRHRLQGSAAGCSLRRCAAPCCTWRWAGWPRPRRCPRWRC